jgi:hypothetical protein
MNLQPVTRNTTRPTGQSLRCRHCSQWLPLDCMLADLDGPPFKAYVCGLCAAQQRRCAPDGTIYYSPN